MRLIVLRARIAPGEAAPAGTLRTDAALKQLFVACGQGAVEIIELQPAGKRRMAATEFLRGNLLLPGARVGREAS